MVDKHLTKPSGTIGVPAWLLRDLSRLGGIDVSPGGASSRLRIHVSGESRSRLFQVSVKPRLSAEEAARVAEHLRTDSARGGNVLLATYGLSEGARLALQRRGISWIERDTGVCYLRARGLLVDRCRPPSESRPAAEGLRGIERRTRLRGKSGLIVESVLLSWAAHRTTLRLGSVAAAAGVSRQLASRVLRRLTAEQMLRSEGTRRRREWRVVEGTTVLDTWAEEERAEPEVATGVYVWSRSVHDLYGKLAVGLRALPRWAVGGVSAASLYAPHLTVDPVPEVWIPADIPGEKVASMLGGEVVGSGANVFLHQSAGDVALRHAAPRPLPPRTEQLSGPIPEVMLVSQPRAYVEARRATGRGPEVARHVRSTFLDGASLEGGPS